MMAGDMCQGMTGFMPVQVSLIYQFGLGTCDSCFGNAFFQCSPFTQSLYGNKGVASKNPKHLQEKHRRRRLLLCPLQLPANRFHVLLYAL